jgi:hypothetical protein
MRCHEISPGDVLDREMFSAKEKGARPRRHEKVHGAHPEDVPKPTEERCGVPG